MARYEGTVRKTYAGYKWVNSYRIEIDSLKDAQTVMGYLVNFEALITYSQVTIDRTRVAGWRSEDPNDFITTPRNVSGVLLSGSQPLATPQSCLHIALAAPDGRPGKRFYRYALTQEEVFGVGDEMRLALAGTHETDIEAAATALMANLDAAGAVLVIGDWPAVGPGRPATGLVIAGAANVDIHHGWFNKSTGS